jgi:uncharacterized phage protein (TIGR01671 family)
MGMREILFRGKREFNEWSEGSLIIWEDGSCAIEPGSLTEPMMSVNPETVGQFTGLTDKNGKKIFEGDIIKFHKYRGEPDWTGVVKYEHCSYIAVGRMPLAYEKRIGEEPYFCPFEVQLSGIDKATINVIGNIHDNPELIGGKGNA